MLSLVLVLCLIRQVVPYCQKNCNGHGTCNAHDICQCFNGKDGYPAFTGNDCALRTCPMGISWIGELVSSNDMHPVAECSNKGNCDRRSGTCLCFMNFDGSACERTVCPNDCNGFGVCYTQQQLADSAGVTYTTPWDAKKQVPLHSTK